MDINIVHCMECLNIFEEREDFIEVCPHCKNEDTTKTHYLITDEEERGDE